MSFKSFCFKKPLTAQAVAVGIQRPRTRRWAQVANAAEKDPISSLVRFLVAAVAAVAGVAKLEVQVSSEREVGRFGNCECDRAEPRI
jgi:hypothetical protein